MKVALLSNINVEPIIRLLNSKSEHDIYYTEGYGNELGILLNKKDSLYRFNPQIVFVIPDIMEIIQHDLNITSNEYRINEWFLSFERSIEDNIIYYVADAYLYGIEMDIVCDKNIQRSIESIWGDKLNFIIKKKSNIRIFPYSSMVRKVGENNAFSTKMWYMGKILHSNAFQKELAQTIIHYIDIENSAPKKVLLLDLDNTLWKGIAGENDIIPIQLSEDGIGLAYKNFQRAIFQLKNQGVILGIVSKNNEKDAKEIISHHPHMVLHEDDFVAMRINWDNKADNILSISKELNVGVDSIVFVDDNPAERLLINEILPDVITPEFPERPEELCKFISDIYHRYFEKPVVTDEDKKKTSQYKANNERKKMMDVSKDYDTYLTNLQMKLYRADPKKNLTRLVQLINKTNQFNLTTRRVTEQEVADILEDSNTKVFLYKVVDKFGDNGIVAVGIIEFNKEAVITEFTMSCRVMGRRIEDAIIEDFEREAKSRGYKKLIAVFKPTEKNKPVERLYDSFGYKVRRKFADETIEYEINLNDDLTRKSFVEKIQEEI